MSDDQRRSAMPAALPDYARKNRELWQSSSDSYEEGHADALGDEVETEWARRWTMENIWQLRKERA